MELTPYICQCCGGKIDISSMKCPYCDTAYHHPSLERINVIKLERGQHLLGAEVHISREVMLNANPESIRDYALDELKQQLADGLLAYIKISTCEDRMNCAEIIRGEVVVLDPMFDPYGRRR